MTNLSSPHRAPFLLSPWRKLCQWIVTLLLLLTPWFNIKGNSVLRIDIPELSMYFFGQTLRIEELYLVLISSLILTLGFLLITMALGRVWCGWFCPQTTLTDLAEWFAKVLKINQGQPKADLFKKAVLHCFYLALAFLVSSNLLWYFIEPLSFFSLLASGQMHYATWISLLLVAALVYLDLAVVRRLMCREICPYGRFQATLADESTLALHLPHAELERCIKCNSCVRACPMEIDIRQGYQVECINCGRCLDACRRIMANRDQPGLISYHFGTAGKGVKALLNRKTMLLFIVILLLSLIMMLAVIHRPPASLKIAVSHTASSRELKDGNRATFFNAWVNNRSDEDAVYDIIARRAKDNGPLILKGPTAKAHLAAGENLRIDFVLITPADKDKIEVDFVLVDQTQNELATTRVNIK
jgi:polyferredoxin